MIASTQTNSPLSGNGEVAGLPKSQIEIATARLKSAGLRVTQPRLAILAALCRHDQPTSIEQIHADVGAATCDLVTVYRCMAAFEKIGLVTRAFFHNGTALYKMSVGRLEQFHVVCKATNAVDELDPDTAAGLRQAIKAVKEKLEARGYTEVGHIVEFFGVAPALTSRRQSLVATRHAAPAMPVLG